MSVEIAAIKKQGWKQGSFLCLTADHNSLKAGLYLVISHSCDLIHEPLLDEPMVELLKLSEIEKEKFNGNFTYGKNPRKIHFSLNSSNNQGKQHYYECSIINRFFLDRRMLVSIQPYRELTISEKTLDSVIAWIIKRYNRAAFPDAFNKSIYGGKKKEKIKEILQKKPQHIQDIYGLFITLDPQREISAGEIYKVELIMLVDYDHYSNLESLVFEDILEKIVTVIKKAPTNIEITRYAVNNLEEMTAAQLYNSKELDFDHLSYRDN